MKKSTLGIIVIVLIIVVAIILIVGRSSGTNGNPDLGTVVTPPGATESTPAVVSGTSKVSSKTSEFQNAELGFSVKYPTAWEADNTDTGVMFVMPIDQNQVSTIAKLEGDINVAAGKCAFPPVTTVKDRGTLVVGSDTLDMISISNSVQGRGYFDRLYSLQHGDVCYIFTFASITLAPSAKNLTGSNITQAQNNNKAIINAADADFTTMVKTFTFTQSPQGIDETKAPKAQ